MSLANCGSLMFMSSIGSRRGTPTGEPAAADDEEGEKRARVAFKLSANNNPRNQKQGNFRHEEREVPACPRKSEQGEKRGSGLPRGGEEGQT